VLCHPFCNAMYKIIAAVPFDTIFFSVMIRQSYLSSSAGSSSSSSRPGLQERKMSLQNLNFSRPQSQPPLHSLSKDSVASAFSLPPRLIPPRTLDGKVLRNSSYCFSFGRSSPSTLCRTRMLPLLSHSHQMLFNVLYLGLIKMLE
jgi:hypothetical protein